MLAARSTVAALVPAVAAVGSIAASRRAGSSPILVALPGARVRFGADVDGAPVSVPSSPAAVGTFDVRALPSIRSPLACRAWLASAWHYIASTRSSGPGWDAAARKRWAYIATLKIQYYGPAGFYAQPGWVDLAERASKRDDGAGGVFLEDDPRWRDFASYVRSVVIPAFNVEWSSADLSARLEIGQAWQRAYRDVSVRETLEKLPGLPSLPSGGLGGFGFALGLAAVGVVAFVALRPDVAASIAGESVARARKARAAYRKSSR